MGLLLFGCMGCRQENSLTEEYRELAKVTEKMKGSSFWVLDSTRSSIRFEANQSSSAMVSGKIPLHKGTLLMEKESVLAGFFEGKLSDCRVEENNSHLDMKAELKMLKDSLPVLFSRQGSRIRADLMQGGKQVQRTGYREPVVSGSGESCTHIFQVKWEFADSVLTIPLPATLKFEKKNTRFAAVADLGYQDFGLFYRRMPGGASVWMPLIKCRIELVFKPFKP